MPPKKNQTFERPVALQGNFRVAFDTPEWHWGRLYSEWSREKPYHLGVEYLDEVVGRQLYSYLPVRLLRLDTTYLSVLSGDFETMKMIVHRGLVRPLLGLVEHCSDTVVVHNAAKALWHILLAKGDDVITVEMLDIFIAKFTSKNNDYVHAAAFSLEAYARASPERCCEILESVVPSVSAKQWRIASEGSSERRCACFASLVRILTHSCDKLTGTEMTKSRIVRNLVATLDEIFLCKMPNVQVHALTAFRGLELKSLLDSDTTCFTLKNLPAALQFSMSTTEHQSLKLVREGIAICGMFAMRSKAHTQAFVFGIDCLETVVTEFAHEKGSDKTASLDCCKVLVESMRNGSQQQKLDIFRTPRIVGALARRLAHIDHGADNCVRFTKESSVWLVKELMRVGREDAVDHFLNHGLLDIMTSNFRQENNPQCVLLLVHLLEHYVLSIGSNTLQVADFISEFHAELLEGLRFQAENSMSVDISSRCERILSQHFDIRIVHEV